MDDFWTICEARGSETLDGALGVGGDGIKAPSPPLINPKAVALVRLVARYLNHHLEKHSNHQGWHLPLDAIDQRCTKPRIFPVSDI
jgi:hypothetical protein